LTKVVVTQKISDEAVAQLRQEGFEVLYHESDSPWENEVLKTAVSDADGIICLLTDKITPDVMDAAQNVKIIANVAVGYDNINVPAATERGIVVTNTPDVLTETTADLAFALLLAIARRIPEADTYMRAGKYQKFEFFPEMMGVDVFGKTLGVVGMGRIGTAVARRGCPRLQHAHLVHSQRRQRGSRTRIWRPKGIDLQRCCKNQISSVSTHR
jgi:glyoxylate reductase